MAVKEILLHLDTTPRAAPRLDLAVDLAKRLDARLIGLFVVDMALPVFAGAEFGGGAAMASVIQQMQDDALSDSGRTEAMFRDKLRQAGVEGEWRQAEGFTAAQVALHGRYADLVMIGQPDPGDPASAVTAAVEAALFDTGRPVLVVPAAGHFTSLGRRVLIGWNASREASRAVHDALPLLAGAESVAVVIVDPEGGPEGHGEEPGADIARHLARHGLRVEVHRVVGADLAAGDILLNEAADRNADLIVMGGYGHSRLREFVMGGATRTLLRQMTAPVLLSH